MTAQVQTAFALLLLLQVKHLFADFFLQTPRMLSDRAKVLHLGRFHHTFLHAAFSAIILLLIGADLLFIAVICLLELVLHYLIDLTKGRHAEMTGHGPDDAGYWRAFGVDQLAHQVTYVGMVWVWLAFAA